MDEPATSIRSGSAAARSRSKRAKPSGFVLDIGGLPVLVHAADADHLAVIDTVFGSVGACAADARAELVYRTGRLRLPRRKPDERHPDLDVWRDGELLYLSSEVHAVRAVASPTRIDIVGTARAHERSFRRIFQPVITHVLAHNGIFVVHAASMRNDDHGVLTLGETGKGKSTMALAALQHGWRVMGDDLAALWIADDGPMIRGIPKAMALPSDLTSTRVAQLEGAEELEWDHRGRLHVPSDRLDLAPVKLSSVLAVEHGEATTSKVERSTADAITSRLMGSFTSVGNAELMRRFFPVAIRASQVPGWIVHHGTDSTIRVAEAQRILSELAATW
jgi:hypothetical protein